ncbi:MAG: Nif3-like dinuclear metal center hexameric protein [Marinifilaceae bacterium]|jgi:dinuclear metal center YbgI/SA1388 family protein|nr:Nif3-like dinuclear metal center hexameric protein [Marinifilaceae bacterium]
MSQKIKLSEIIKEIEDFANPSLQESYDNSGLIVGDRNMMINAALISLDITEELIDEAIEKSCNLIISHHPIVFGGLKRFTGSNSVQKIIMKAIKNDIAIYSAHTNIDSVMGGVSDRMAQMLGLVNKRILSPNKESIYKVSVFVPEDHLDIVASKMFEKGAGKIGKYDSCAFYSKGKGSFRALEGADPYVGELNKLHYENETKIECICSETKLSSVIKAMKQSHPYEEVAYDIIKTEQKNPDTGFGIVGDLPNEMDSMDFLKKIKTDLQTDCVRYTKLVKNKIKRVALCGGSGSSLLRDAIASKADVFITGDFKYHDFFNAENRIIIADIGHFESEQFTTDIFYEIVTKKITNFAAYISDVKSNPINYL